MSGAAKYVVWKVLELRVDVASVRYRALMPALGLHERGYDSIFLQYGERPSPLSNICAAVFVKSFSAEDFALAEDFCRAGIPVILDLCDNVFIPEYELGPFGQAFAHFKAMAAISRAVLVPTEELATQLRRQTGYQGRVVVIPDQVETEATAREVLRFRQTLAHCRRHIVPRILARLPSPLAAAMTPAVRAASRLVGPRSVVRQKARHLLARSDPLGQAFLTAAATAAPTRLGQRAAARRRVIWFGNHGAPHSMFGMPSLAAILPNLKALNEAIPIELAIVSNNVKQFTELFSNLPFPASYAQWDLLSIFANVSSADVCVLPNPRDDFSLCKSQNRAVLALALGVPVVADSIPSLDDFKECVIFDDWVGGIQTYLSDPDRTARDVARARGVIGRLFGRTAVTNLWQALLETVGACAPVPLAVPSGITAQCVADTFISGKAAGSSGDSLTGEQLAEGISIALCTFNGERFLDKQLESLARQTLPPLEIVVCDDGSTDGTVAAVTRFARRAPFPVRLFANVKHLGIKGNFEKALARCRGRYIALADQDDVWNKEKLSELFGEMEKVQATRGNDKPILIHSDMTVVDKDGEVIHGSYFRLRGLRRRHRQPLGELVAQNYVTGCTTLINRPLLDLVLPIPAGAPIHDWWIALVAAASGVVRTVPRPLVHYRAHSANAVGPKGREWLSLLALPNMARANFQPALLQSYALQAVLAQHSPNSEALRFISRYHSLLRRGGISGAIALLKEGVRRQGGLATLIFLVHVALRSFGGSVIEAEREGLAQS